MHAIRSTSVAIQLDVQFTSSLNEITNFRGIEVAFDLRANHERFVSFLSYLFLFWVQVTLQPRPALTAVMTLCAQASVLDSAQDKSRCATCWKG